MSPSTPDDDEELLCEIYSKVYFQINKSNRKEKSFLVILHEVGEAQT